jgi:hypothetical protein
VLLPPAAGHTFACAATGSRGGARDPPHLLNVTDAAHLISSAPGRNGPPPLLIDVDNVPLLLS